MRIGPLLAASAMRPEALADAVNELAERSWVKITRRTTRPHPPADLPELFHPVDRVTTTGFGKWRYPVTWPVD